MENIATFTVSGNDGALTLRIMADGFEIGSDGDDSCWAEAGYIEIVEIGEDGEALPYKPTGSTWSGHRYDEADLLALASSAYVNANPSYDFIEVCPELEQMGEKAALDIACHANGRDIPSCYYEFWRGELFKLSYVTDENVYYSYYDSVRMLDADGNLISDNYFAEEGLRDSIERVLAGEEEEIWCCGDTAEYKEMIEKGEA